MRVSTRGRYALRIMVNLAMREQGQIARKQDIASNEDISEDYVEQLLTKLRTADLVRSIRGKHGGFLLNRDPENISVLDILEVTEGPTCMVPCIDDACSRMDTCSTRSMWERASDAIERVFRETTIAKLAEDARCRKRNGEQTYEI